MRHKNFLTVPLRAVCQLQGLAKRGCVKCLRFLVMNAAKIAICCCITIAGIFVLLTFSALFYSVYVSVKYGRINAESDPLAPMPDDVLDEYDQLEAGKSDDFSGYRQKQRLLRFRHNLESRGGGGGWRRRIRLAKARLARAKKRQRVAKSDDFVDEEPFAGDGDDNSEAVADEKKSNAPMATQKPVVALKIEPRHLSRKARDTHAQLKQLEKDSRRKCQNSGTDGSLRNPFAKVKYRIIEQSLCTSEVDILILVHSHWSHSERRELIRSTYGSLNNVRDSIVRLAFVTGLPDGSGERAAIHQESRIYRDIVLGEFSDTRSRRLHKDFLSLHWALNFCPTAKFVAKLSDNTFVDTVHLATFLDRTPMPEFLYCTVQRNKKPTLRFMRRQILRGVNPRTNLSPFCASTGFVATSSNLARMLGCGQALHPLLATGSGDFFTGAVVAKAGLSLVDAWKGHAFGQLNRNTALPPVASDYIFLTLQWNPDSQSLPVDESSQSFLWRATWKYLVAQYEF